MFFAYSTVTTLIYDTMKEKKPKQPKEKLRCFYVYATGHGIPSHFIMHVGYQDADLPRGTYPTWFSEPVTKEVADKIYDKVKWQDGLEWTGEKGYKLQKQIEKYIKMSKEGKL